MRSVPRGVDCRAPSRSSSACTWLLTMVVDMLRRRPAAENPPLSTTRTKAVRLVSRSIRQAPDYLLSLDNASNFSGIITRQPTLHLLSVPGALLQRGAQAGTEDAMSITSYVSDTKEKISFRPSRKAVKRAALALAVALGAAGAGHFGYGYLTTGRYLESTDDAYVKADSTIISPKVSGYIAQVLVGDNQPVTAGQLLARIDDRDFRAALDSAHADVDASEAAVRNLDAQIALQQPIIEQGTADVAAAEANLQFAREEQTRYDGLMKTGSGTIQRAQQTDAALREKTAQLQHGKSGLQAAQRKVDVLSTERAKAVAQLDRARAVEQQAALNLSYTRITAPVDGTVGARSLRVGQFVQAGTQLMAVVPLDAVYVLANFIESQLTHSRSGQPVQIRTDSFHS